jgi:uncharacterized protein (DUF1697 family)
VTVAASAKSRSAGRHVALLRGINVGKAKRVSMADLRALVEALGYRDCVTLLNSGNVVFSGGRGRTEGIARRIEEALVRQTGVAARVMVRSAAELSAIVEENTLGAVAGDPSRLLVAFLGARADKGRLRALTKQDWSPERLAVGRYAAYLWCPNGILAGRLPEALGQAVGAEVTSRNWATVLKLRALL